MALKLIIQVPCYNEAETLGITLKELPRTVDGFDAVECLIIDDGCTDETVEVARSHGVDHILQLTKNQGLARGFMAGLNYALKMGADVIVNTDGDNQYHAGDIPALTRPILEGKADIVIGTRPIDSIQHFSPLKKILQKVGSWAVRVASHTDVPDAPSGFRALSREAAMQINVFNEYTYTLETIIQAGRKNLAITSVPIQVNGNLRPSRLFKSIPHYLRQSIVTIVRIFVVYNPFRFFMAMGGLLFTAGFLVGVRFLFFYFSGNGGGHIQSLVLSSILLGMGFQAGLFAFIVDLLAVNRKLLEETQYKLRKMENASTGQGR